MSGEFGTPLRRFALHRLSGGPGLGLPADFAIKWTSKNLADKSAMVHTIFTSTSYQINPLGDGIAAEVIGLDLRQAFDDETFGVVHQAFLDNRILAFRDQDLTKEEQVAFTEQFGALERHTVRNRGSADSPFVHIVSNLDANIRPTGQVDSMLWHSDKSFRPEPSMATVLHAKVLPPKGGDTVFADMAGAYDVLSDGEKVEIDGLRVVHSWELSRLNEGRMLTDEEVADAPPNAHPLVRVHPDTGRHSLFIGMHASHLEGVEFEEGRARILALEAHATQDEFIYRHVWRLGDVLLWDNRCLLHRADDNFDANRYPRVLHRTCLRGTPTS